MFMQLPQDVVLTTRLRTGAIGRNGLYYYPFMQDRGYELPRRPQADMKIGSPPEEPADTESDIRALRQQFGVPQGSCVTLVCTGSLAAPSKADVGGSDPPLFHPFGVALQVGP